MKISAILLSTLSFCNAAPILDQEQRQFATQDKILKEAIGTNWATRGDIQDDTYSQSSSRASGSQTSSSSSSSAGSQTSGSTYGSETWGRTSGGETTGGTYNWQTSGSSQTPDRSDDTSSNGWQTFGNTADSTVNGRGPRPNSQVSGSNQTQCDNLKQRVQTLEAHHKVNEQIIQTLISTYLRNQESFILSLRTAQGRMDRLQLNQNQQQNNVHDQSNNRQTPIQQDHRQTQEQQTQQQMQQHLQQQVQQTGNSNRNSADRTPVQNPTRNTSGTVAQSQERNSYQAQSNQQQTQSLNDVSLNWERTRQPTQQQIEQQIQQEIQLQQLHYPRQQTANLELDPADRNQKRDYGAVHKLVSTTPRNANKGVLMVKYNGEWGTVCDDNFSEREAEIACKGLGYVNALSVSNIAHSRGFRAPAGAKIIMDEVNCPSPRAASLLDCRASYDSHNCHAEEAVVIECY